MTAKQIHANLLARIDAELREISRARHPGLRDYYGMLHYHLGWVDEQLNPSQTTSGKHLRPLLCLLSCQALGGDLEQALPAACSIEMVHNFSLVHDDIQDGSHTRRGRRAVWDIWGMNHGINAGDGLFVLAHLGLHRLSDRGVSPERQQAVSLAMDQACLALCEGQYFDMAFEGRLDVGLDQYLNMIRLKTAALMAAATQIGAVLATEDAHAIEQCYQFGEHLGLAFQIQDDILGTWGDERATGKSAASDIRDRKNTFPVVYALSQSQDRQAAHELSALYAHPAPLDRDATDAVLDILQTVHARQHAEEIAIHYYHLALQNLEETGIEPAAQGGLRALASSLLGRQA